MSTSKPLIPPPLASAAHRVKTRWHTLAAREKTAFQAVAAVLVVFLIFSVGLRPAWRVIQTAPQQLDRLDADLQTMSRLAAESQSLRQLPPVSAVQAADVLTAATNRLGANARLALVGNRATLTLTGIPGDALSAWLREARSAARARPEDAQLMRNPQGYAGTITMSFGGTP